MQSRLYPRDLFCIAGAATLSALVAAPDPGMPTIAALAAGAAAGAGLYGYRSVLQLIHWASAESLKSQQEDYRQLQAFLQLQNMIRTRLPLPAMRGMAISPDFALLLISEILRRKPAVVVELGSGVSTLVSGYCLEQIGAGRVFSLEHHPAYAGATRENVARHGLAAFVTVYDAPLGEVRINGRHFQYYDLSCVQSLPRIDLLMVDGPPMLSDPLARYPALPLFYGKLADDAVILVDDTARPADRAGVDEWLAAYPEFDCRFVDLEKGAAILCRGTTARA